MKLEDIFAAEPYPEGTILNPSGRRQYAMARAESPIELALAQSLLISHRFVVVPCQHAEAQLRKHDIAFVMQHPVEGCRLDIGLFFPDYDGNRHKIAIECDGKAYHTGEQNERRDRARDDRLKRAGFQVWRYIGGAIHHQVGLIADEIQDAVQAIMAGEEPVLTFSRGRSGEPPTLREYEQAYWAFRGGVLWPRRMGANPDQRGWDSIDAMMADLYYERSAA